MPNNSSASVIGRNALWSVLNQSVGQILALLVFLITARFISKDAFGVMAVSMLAIEFFRQVMIESVGISLAAKQYPSKEDYNAGFIVIIAGSFISAATMFLLAGPISELLKNPDLIPALRLTSLVLLAMGLSRTHETWMAKNMKFKLLAIRSIIATSIGGAVGVFMAVRGYGLLSLIAQQILTSSLSMIFLWLASSWRPSVDTTFEHIKSLLSYSKHVSMNFFTGVIGTQGDIFFASYYLGATATGVYNASKRILVATQLMVTSGLNSVALPVFSSYSDNTEKLKDVYLKAVFYTTLLTAPLYVGLSFLSKDIISIVLGAKWLDAAPVISILTITAFMASIDQYNTNTILVCKKPHWQTCLTAINAVLNLLMLALVAKHGLLAVAGGMAIKSLFLFPLSLYLALKLLKGTISEYLLNIYPIVTSALFMGGAVHYLNFILPVTLNPYYVVGILVPTGAIIYIVSLYFLDRNLINQLRTLSKTFLRAA